MTIRSTDLRRCVARAGSVRVAQRGSAVRGLVVAIGLVAAIALQLAGPRLQSHFAELVGTPAVAPVVAPASMPSCGAPSTDNPMHPCKVAVAIAGTAPVI